MKIPTDFDVVHSPAPAAEKGTPFGSYSGLNPNEKPIADTPGEKATNDPTAYSTSKGSPLKGGSGYTKSSS